MREPDDQVSDEQNRQEAQAIMEMAPEQRITLALEAAAFHNAGVRALFLIESTGEWIHKQADEP
jgi:hypothetical protein